MSDAARQAADQQEFWNGDIGRRWAEHYTRFDALLETPNARLLAAAGARPGERVLDIGCGCGATSLALASQVGARGAVLGIDISQPMLAIARRRAETAPPPRPDFQVADAATAVFPAPFDLAVSRFGVMFFAEPTAAFATLRRALKPGGRLAFICWQEVKANPWMSVPLFAALAHVPPPPPADPLAPGPFALADPVRVRTILGEAGFVALDVRSATVPINLGQGPRGPLEEAVDLVTSIGPASAVLTDVDGETRARATAAVRAALEPHATPTGLVLPGACWLVTARA